MPFIALRCVSLSVLEPTSRNYLTLQWHLVPHANRFIQLLYNNIYNNQENISQSLYNLSFLYSDQGKLKEAEEIYQPALEGKEKILGLKYISIFGTINNLGFLYRSQGKLKEVEEMYQRALEGYKKILGSEHTSTLNIINNLIIRFIYR